MSKCSVEYYFRPKIALISLRHSNGWHFSNFFHLSFSHSFLFCFSLLFCLLVNLSVSLHIGSLLTVHQLKMWHYLEVLCSLHACVQVRANKMIVSQGKSCCKAISITIEPNSERPLNSNHTVVSGFYYLYEKKCYFQFKAALTYSVSSAS